MNTTNPTVSVVMITYGQEKYIKQAIEGVLIQKTNFDVELIIANDCSPDNTNSVINSIKNIPNTVTIKYTCHEKNLGMIANFEWALNQTKGKYIAICEGDDYWTNENKLQIQYDFMENNPEYAICCHNFKVLKDNVLHEESVFDKMDMKDTFTIDDLAHNNIIPTLSSFFRNKKISFPLWSKDAPVGDLILFLDIAKDGKIKYFEEKWAVYRQNVGVWHKNKVNFLRMTKLYENLSNDYKNFPKAFKNLLANKKKYSKAYLKELSLKEITKNRYFEELSLIEKIKLIIKRILS